jgi:hypothetical protein
MTQFSCHSAARQAERFSNGLPEKSAQRKTIYRRNRSARTGIERVGHAFGRALPRRIIDQKLWIAGKIIDHKNGQTFAADSHRRDQKPLV